VQQKASAELAEILGAKAPEVGKHEHTIGMLDTDGLTKAVNDAMADYDRRVNDPASPSCDTDQESD